MATTAPRCRALMALVRTYIYPLIRRSTHSNSPTPCAPPPQTPGPSRDDRMYDHEFAGRCSLARVPAAEAAIEGICKGLAPEGTEPCDCNPFGAYSPNTWGEGHSKHAVMALLQSRYVANPWGLTPAPMEGRRGAIGLSPHLCAPWHQRANAAAPAALCVTALERSCPGSIAPCADPTHVWSE